jgi:polyhydroxyalkanoate depolymerase
LRERPRGRIVAGLPRQPCHGPNRTDSDANRHLRALLDRAPARTLHPFYDVYITDWVDARTLPLSSGRFDLDDYIEYVIAICETLSKEHEGAIVHTIGVCQPAVPLIAAIALMEARDSPHVSASMRRRSRLEGQINPHQGYICK